MKKCLVYPIICLMLLVGVPPFPAAREAVAQDENRVPSGHVSVKIAQGAFLVSAGGGEGTLTFKGKDYPFKLGGLGVGGIGGQLVEAEGEVYNLTSIEDFPGVYLNLEGGYSAWQGKSDLWLKNGRGVKIELHSRTHGLMMTVGAEGLAVTMSGDR